MINFIDPQLSETEASTVGGALVEYSEDPLDLIEQLGYIRRVVVGTKGKFCQDRRAVFFFYADNSAIEVRGDDIFIHTEESIVDTLSNL